jgi:hypothetical protein
MVATLVGSGAAVARLACPAIKAIENVLAIAALKMLIAALLSLERIDKETETSEACSDRPHLP